MWTGATEGQDFHLVLLDNGRTATLADPRGRAAWHCIRCSACLTSAPSTNAPRTACNRVEGVHGPRILDVVITH